VLMDIEKLRTRIRALQVRTEANGCTEAEALTAAAKLSELLDRHDLDLGDQALRDTPCERLNLETGRKQRQPMDAYLPALAAAYGCRVWMERDAKRKITYVIFGLPAALEMVRSMHQMFGEALAAEWVRFRDAQRFIRQNEDAKAGFQFGMAAALADRLQAQQSDRQKLEQHAATGRGLIALRHDVVERAFDDLGLALRQSGGSGRRFATDMFAEGEHAAKAVSLPDAG
jgi:hypothetical protein